jgi:hypothetical protein
MAGANSVSRAPSARFSFVTVSRGGILSRRPPLCGPSGYCLRQTPSVPPIGYRLNYVHHQAPYARWFRAFIP